MTPKSSLATFFTDACKNSESCIYFLLHVGAFMIMTKVHLLHEMLLLMHTRSQANISSCTRQGTLCIKLHSSMRATDGDGTMVVIMILCAVLSKFCLCETG